jgi:ADP-ribose pyrophosphatase YjhB (NUDIX family)
MTKGAMAALSAGVAVFGFDPEPGTPASRALHVLTVKRTLPTGDLGPKERFPEAALRAATEAGIDLGGRRGARGAQRLHLVGVDDDPARARSVTVWYYAASPYGPVPGPGVWSATGRGLHLDATGAAALRAALDRLRADTRQLAGAAALVGDVFTGDDLLRLHVALHGGPEGSERTFRRRIQELRDSGVLRPVRDTEVAALRLRVPRFRSPAGTGGRPPELLRYSGAGGEDEQLAALRARRAG